MNKKSNKNRNVSQFPRTPYNFLRQFFINRSEFLCLLFLVVIKNSILFQKKYHSRRVFLNWFLPWKSFLMKAHTINKWKDTIHGWIITVSHIVHTKQIQNHHTHTWNIDFALFTPQLIKHKALTARSTSRSILGPSGHFLQFFFQKASKSNQCALKWILKLVFGYARHGIYHNKITVSLCNIKGLLLISNVTN